MKMHGFLVAPILLVFLVSTANAATIIVDDEGDGNYTTINEALANAGAGDTIEVYSGFYQEIVIVNTPLITFNGFGYELGEGDDTGKPIIDAGGGYGGADAIKINADNTTVNGFVLQNSGQEAFAAGIDLRSNYNTINNSVAIGNRYGIVLLSGSSHNTVSGTEVWGNTWGFYSEETQGNDISNNRFLYNWKGILGVETHNNLIVGNSFQGNSDTGVELILSYENRIFHNVFIGNGLNAYNLVEFGCGNLWDDGYPSGGNFWDDYAGEEENGDGIGDTPHHIPEACEDRYPFIEQDGWLSGPEVILPDTYTVLRGNIVSGGLEELLVNDDERLEIDSALTMGDFEAPVRVAITGLSTTVSPSNLAFSLEAHALGGNITQKIELYNYETGSYEAVDERAATAYDSIARVELDGNLSRFVNPETLELKAHLSWKNSLFTMFWPYRVGIDHTIWTMG